MSRLKRKIEDLEARIAALERHVASERAGSEELEALREELARPVERTAGDIEKALSIVGTGEGPGDLSRNLRKCLRGKAAKRVLARAAVEGRRKARA
ncbi:MAG: hypothetical protein HPY58_09665 [Firmicutes bacterium]|nr:hypothetical protein [Bacillota bacterium]